MTRRTVALAGVALAGVALTGVLLGGCTGDADRPTATEPAPATPVATASLPPASGSVGTDAEPDPDDPALDVALSEPVEDSVYPDVGDPGVDALHYDLDLAWTPATRTLDALATIELRATTTADRLQLDLAPGFEVTSVSLDGAPVQSTHRGKELVVSAPVEQDERYVLDVAYRGSPGPTPAPTVRSDIDGVGWHTTGTGEVWTMQEPYGAFTWYPVNDQPSDKALYDISVTAPAPFVGVANGVMTDQSTVDGSTTTSWQLATPAASYLVTVAIGDYRRTTATSASGLEISFWVPSDRPGLADRLAYAPDGLDWLEDRLGPFPFDSLGFVLVDSQSGMETQTMITLGTGEYATSPAVLVHEMAHQWYGDEVTPADWSDLWMNEGMAMYLQGAWQADDDGRDVGSVMDEWAAFEPRVREESGPPAAYDPTMFGAGNVYYSPALMWEELRTRIGDERFGEVLRDWPALGPRTADREDYLTWLVGHTGVDRSFFDEWLLSPTTPPRS